MEGVQDETALQSSSATVVKDEEKALGSDGTTTEVVKEVHEDTENNDVERKQEEQTDILADETTVTTTTTTTTTDEVTAVPPYGDMDQVRAACEQIITPENCSKMTIKMAKQKLCEFFNASYEEIDKYRGEIKNVVKEIGSAVSLAAVANEEEEEEDSEEVSSRRRAAKRPAATKKSSPKGIKRQQARLMTKAFFVKNGENMDLTLGSGVSEKCVPKEFSTGSCGWGLSKKVSFKVGDKEVQCQLSVNCIAVGSKQWAERDSNEEEEEQEDGNN